MGTRHAERSCGDSSGRFDFVDLDVGLLHTESPTEYGPPTSIPARYTRPPSGTRPSSWVKRNRPTCGCAIMRTSRASERPQGRACPSLLRPTPSPRLAVDAVRDTIRSVGLLVRRAPWNPSTGHSVMNDEPTLIVDAVKFVLDQIRAALRSYIELLHALAVLVGARTAA